MRSTVTRLIVLAVALGPAAPVARAVQHPDAWITTKAKMALFTTKGIRSTAINVDTVDGRVTLQGKVGSADEKEKAESTVRGMTGVKEVRNLLQVIPESGRKAVRASDTELKKQVKTALKDDQSLGQSSISVQSVNAGVVVLTGKASSMDAHLHAIEDARGVPGVQQVSSEIRSPNTLAD